jgi:hypothetical protein
VNCGHLSFEVKHGAQCDVDLHEFVRVQAACEVTEALRVDGGGLLDQYPDILAEEFDGGVAPPGAQRGNSPGTPLPHNDGRRAASGA